MDDLPFEFQPPGTPPRRARPAPRRTSRGLLLAIAGVALAVGVLAGSALARRPASANLQTLTQDVRIVTVTVTMPRTG